MGRGCLRQQGRRVPWLSIRWCACESRSNLLAEEERNVVKERGQILCRIGTLIYHLLTMPSPSSAINPTPYRDCFTYQYLRGRATPYPNNTPPKALATFKKRILLSKKSSTVPFKHTDTAIKHPKPVKLTPPPSPTSTDRKLLVRHSPVEVVLNLRDTRLSEDGLLSIFTNSSPHATTHPPIKLPQRNLRYGTTHHPPSSKTPPSNSGVTR